MRDKGTAWSAFLLFMLGVGSETKTFFYGCVSFSELAVFAIAPLVLLKHFKRLIFERLMMPVYMFLGLMVSMLVSSMVNHTAMPFVIKSFAVMYGVLSYYLVFSQLLKNNPKGLGWFFVGAAISTIITIFAFNPQAMVSESGFSFVGQSDVEEVISGPLFWLQRLKAFGQIPIMGWYLHTPLMYSILVPIAFTAFAMFTTISGRSASLSILLAGAFMLFGRKSRASMRTIGRHFYLFVIFGLLMIFAYKTIYAYAARTGWLGAETQIKYENQADKGNGILALLMSGRKEFFIAIPAALDAPIFGHGPHAEDRRGYTSRFLAKYGSYDEINAYRYLLNRALKFGYRLEIPAHSHIMGAWVHYGLFGFVFYCWLLYVIYRQVKRYMAAVPQWYGYFAISIGMYLWHIFFSPPGNRALLGLLIATLYVAKAIGDGRIMLPYKLELEAREYD